MFTLFTTGQALAAAKNAWSSRAIETFSIPEAKAATPMAWFVVKLIISATLIAVVSEIATRMPRLGALLLTLPIISIIAFVMTWYKSYDMVAISKLATETLILVPLGLPFFIPFALASRTGLSFWSSFVLGLLLAAISIGAWFRFAPENFV